MDINEFMREVYLAATPSVDLNDLKEGEQIGCYNGKLYKGFNGELYVEFEIEDSFYDTMECRIFKSMEIYENYKSEEELKHIESLLSSKRRRLKEIQNWLNKN